MRKSLSQLSRQFADRATELDAQADNETAAASIPVPYFAGITVSGKRENRANTDLVRPLFRRDDMEFQRYDDEDIER
jgi:hypothetical protein